MKKIWSILLCMLIAMSIQAQTFPGVTAEVFPLSPQSGNHNYFGVRVTLAQTYSQDVTITGYIFDDGNGPNTNHPFSLVVTAGNLTAETAANYYETDATAAAAFELSTVSPWPSFPLINLTKNLLDYIDQKLSDVNTSGAGICSQVNTITNDVSVSSGVLVVPNWVRFVQIGNAIDSLNGVWDNIYASAMNDIVSEAFTLGVVNGANNAANQEAVWDIVEENLFNVPASKATACLENKFGFTSLQSLIESNENSWLNNGGTDMSQNPSLNEDLPEEFWSLFSTSKTVTITDGNIANQLLYMDADSSTKKGLLSTIKEIVDILGAVLNGIQQVAGMMKDCDGSTEAKVRQLKNGLPFDNDNRKIGYEIEQKSITFDFNSTETKIKGKARLFKKKSNSSNFKRDRKNLVGISFCVREWNGCDDKEWPLDGNAYQHPLKTKPGNVKTHMNQPISCWRLKGNCFHLFCRGILLQCFLQDHITDHKHYYTINKQ